jgi:DNA end-binding protein Ku
VEDEEIKRMAPPSAKAMEILEFVKSSDVDPVYFESSYYMAPDEAGERPYALLYEALERTGYTGVAKITMHNREHIALFRPGPTGLMMHTMYYADEVRGVEEFRTDKTLVKEKELELARMLIESLAAEFQPEKYRDSYRDNLRALIDAKVQGREVVAPPQPETARVIDIMEALKQSLAIARKPAATAEAADSQPAEMPKRVRAGAKRKAAG